MLITFLFISLFARLLYVQVINGKNLQLRAFDQWTRDLPMLADRGDVIDEKGVLLAQSDTKYSLYARPNELKEKEKAAALLAPILDVDQNKLLTKISKKGVSEITVAKKLSREKMLQIVGLDINGMYLTADSSRYYPKGNFLTQVLGFTDIDGNGQGGIEQYYNEYLKGVNGAVYTQTDLVGKKLPSNVTTFLPSVKGMTTQLTVDAQIQSFVQKATEDACVKYKPKSASCIVMSAKTGQIKALASSPTYDLNNIPRDDMDLLLQGSRNALICDAYEPGSTFKILTSAIGLETNKIKPSYYCNGGSTVDGQRIKCWRSIGHGSQNFQQGIQNSCNCVFMDIALSVGAHGMYDYFNKFGLGQKTGVDMSGEAKGIMLKEQNVKNVDIARIGFGQAIAVTPIQLATAVCSVLNGGDLLQPYIVDKIFDEKGNLAFRNSPTVKNKTVSPHTSELMLEYLLSVVEKGGGKNAYIPGYKIGGKTGTAQKYENGAIARGKYISSFLGYTKVDDDVLVCLMLVDEPQGYVYYGSIVAAPYVKDIFSNIFAYKNILPQYSAQDEEYNKYITMPDLVGKSAGEASAILKSLGLTFESAGDSGRVVYQLPAPNAQIKLKTVAYFALG
ncbi:MAG: penicillin-binding transpeptidase domain-containing protein [Clostridia bacterium]